MDELQIRSRAINAGFKWLISIAVLVNFKRVDATSVIFDFPVVDSVPPIGTGV